MKSPQAVWMESSWALHLACRHEKHAGAKAPLRQSTLGTAASLDSLPPEVPLEQARVERMRVAAAIAIRVRDTVDLCSEVSRLGVRARWEHPASRGSTCSCKRKPRCYLDAAAGSPSPRHWARWVATRRSRTTRACRSDRATPAASWSSAPHRPTVSPPDPVGYVRRVVEVPPTPERAARQRAGSMSAGMSVACHESQYPST
jgi:hypothetical protein